MHEHRRHEHDGRRQHIRQLAELPVQRAPLRANQLRLHDEHDEPQGEHDAVRVVQQARLLEQPREIARPERPYRQREKYDEEARAVAIQSGRQASIHRKSLRQRRPAHSKGPRSERSRRCAQRHRRTRARRIWPSERDPFTWHRTARCKMVARSASRLCHDTSFAFHPRARAALLAGCGRDSRRRNRCDADAGDARRRLRRATAVQQLRRRSRPRCGCGRTDASSSASGCDDDADDGATSAAQEPSTTYGLGRWQWDEVAAEAVLRGAGPERRLTVRDERPSRSCESPSPVEHVLARDAAAPRFERPRDARRRERRNRERRDLQGVPDGARRCRSPTPARIASSGVSTGA